MYVQAFTAPAPALNFGSRDSPFVCRRARRHAVVRIPPRSRPAPPNPSMSLASDLMVKAVEAGAAAVAANTIGPMLKSEASTQETQVEKKRKPWWGKDRQQDRQTNTRDAAAFFANTQFVPTGFVDVFARALEKSSQGIATEPKGWNPMSKKPEGDSTLSGPVEDLANAAGLAIGAMSRAARADKWIRLATCIMIDLIGSGSLSVPLVGDALDLVTAPLCAVLLHQVFRSPALTAASLAEEFLPGTDAIPTATLGWLAQNTGFLESVANIGIGRDGRKA